MKQKTSRKHHRQKNFVNFNQNMENSIQPPQHLRPLLPTPNRTVTEPCCMKDRSHGLGKVSGSSSVKGQRSIAQTPPLGHSPGKQWQSHLTLGTAASPALILAPKPSQGDPASSRVGSPPGPLNPHPGEVCNDEQSPQVSGRQRRVPEVVETLCKKKRRLGLGS